MDSTSYFLLILSASFAVLGIILLLAGGKLGEIWSERASTGEIYRNVHKYIKKKYVKPFLICSYGGILSFLAFLGYSWFKYLMR